MIVARQQDRSARARIGVIGTGWWSTYTHIPGLQANPHAELSAICDADANKLRVAAETYGVQRSYTDHRSMLAEADLDGVVIATPHATHYRLARDCLEHDVHVMLEKPMTLYAKDAQELMLLAQAHGRELMIGYPFNYSPQAIRAQHVIRSGMLGPIQSINLVYNSRILELLQGDDHKGVDPAARPVHGPGAVYANPALSGGGQGHLQITHGAGLLFFVTGLRVARVLALMRNHNLPLDLIDTMVVEFEGGALGTVSGTGNAYGGKFDLQINCANGGIDMDLFAQTTDIRGAEHRHETVPAPSNAEYQRFVTSANLVDVILGRAANGSPAEVGWRAVELLDAAYRSAAADGQAITVSSLYDEDSVGERSQAQEGTTP